MAFSLIPGNEMFATGAQIYQGNAGCLKIRQNTFYFHLCAFLKAIAKFLVYKD